MKVLGTLLLLVCLNAHAVESIICYESQDDGSWGKNAFSIAYSSTDDVNLTLKFPNGKAPADYGAKALTGFGYLVPDETKPGQLKLDSQYLGFATLAIDATVGLLKSSNVYTLVDTTQDKTQPTLVAFGILAPQPTTKDDKGVDLDFSILYIVQDLNQKSADAVYVCVNEVDAPRL